MFGGFENSFQICTVEITQAVLLRTNASRYDEMKKTESMKARNIYMNTQSQLALLPGFLVEGRLFALANQLEVDRMT